jgi:hypothetical protein
MVNENVFQATTEKIEQQPKFFSPQNQFDQK